jgi:hypothetical protein
MPPDGDLNKYQFWGLHLVGDLFDSLHDDRYADFLKDGELDRFLHSGQGPFGGKLPDGGPGSRFPGTGGEGPGDALHGLFTSMVAGLGEVDLVGGADPASADGDRFEVRTARDGTIVTTISHADGSWSMTGTSADGSRTILNEGDGHGAISVVVIERGEHEGDWTVTTVDTAPGRPDRETTTRYHGTDRSPDDGGSDSNSDRNPLSGVDPLRPPSIEQMLDQVEHPGRDQGELDPNAGLEGFQPTKEDQASLGLVVPALETLDPNSGVDPLTSLNLDPTLMHTRDDKDDRIDPNTGSKPMPGG